jgi:hypothetical protein
VSVSAGCASVYQLVGELRLDSDRSGTRLLGYLAHSFHDAGKLHQQIVSPRNIPFVTRAQVNGRHLPQQDSNCAVSYH